ncbi:MAG: LysM peptidoglycan-binding domain-containing protein [Deltaproteobacteria bacterium]|nr:LysM peptidoglycan-binding domain-containing protein [Deltaproteobacteria bacterium]NIS76153.1 LysM peptidoglycan-binding domain-containing protein [Deltaproteobacteria bacterium]
MRKSFLEYAVCLVTAVFLAGCSQTKARVPGNPHTVPAEILVEDPRDTWGSELGSPESESLASGDLEAADSITGSAAEDSLPYADTGSDDPAVLEVGQSQETGLPDPDAEGAQAAAEDANAESPQVLMDTALGFYEASQEFWMQGILDKAMEALDQAYELILKVETDSNPELIQQKDDLRFMISRRILELYTSRYTAVNGNHNAIPLTMNEHVQREINLFRGREKNFFLESYRRSGMYRNMMVEALKEAGMPEELSWLPLIESGFKTHALSRARALGLWQFIPSTGYKFGLSRDTWVDERLDPIKATRAAIAYMDELHRIFGDWTTVLAAYNCGEGSVLRVIRTQRINYLDNFWDLYEMLPRETARYVPRFLAVLHILNDPGKYGISLPEPEMPIPHETVTIGKQMRMKDVAKKLEISYQELKSLNPELRQGATPSGNYTLKVPPGKGEVLLAKIDEIPVWHPPKRAYTYHRVRRGETLSYIAVKYRSSVSAIARANRISRRSIIRVGQRLKIPLGRRARRQVRSYELLPGGKYRVRRGDSLWLIAKKFNTDVRTLQQRNNLKSATLSVGQVLKITDNTKVASYSGGSASGSRYRVKKGDSLWLIAEKFGTDTRTLQRINGLRSTVIHVGQVLQVPN